MYVHIEQTVYPAAIKCQLCDIVVPPVYLVQITSQQGQIPQVPSHTAVTAKSHFAVLSNHAANKCIPPCPSYCFFVATSESHPTVFINHAAADTTLLYIL
jgi:hypothetical protein